MKHVKFPFKRLEKILNEMIDEINRQAPKQGFGISLDSTDSGTVVSVVKGDIFDGSAPPQSSSS